MEAMPKKRKEPKTFDEWVGRVVENHMQDRGLRQEDLAAAAHIPLSLVGRSIRGTRAFTVNEFERIAGVVAPSKPGVAETHAAFMLNQALENYGGMEKFLAETKPRPLSDPSSNLNDLDRKRDEKESQLTGEGWDETGEPRAANLDAENEQPEPEAP